MAKPKAKVKAKAKPAPKKRPADDDDDDGDDGDEDGDDAAAPKKKQKPKPRPKAAISGAVEAAEWLAARGLTTAKTRWNVNVSLDVVDAPAPAIYAREKDTRFHLDIYRDEWGLVFVHKKKTSHIRRTANETIVNGFDQHKLRKELPALASIGEFLRALEAKHGVAFERRHALVRSNVAGAQAALRDWLAKL
jgi:hypothetical protein